MWLVYLAQQACVQHQLPAHATLVPAAWAAETVRETVQTLTARAQYLQPRAALRAAHPAQQTQVQRATRACFGLIRAQRASAQRTLLRAVLSVALTPHLVRVPCAHRVYALPYPARYLWAAASWVEMTQ